MQIWLRHTGTLGYPEKVICKQVSLYGSPKGAMRSSLNTLLACSAALYLNRVSLRQFKGPDQPCLRLGRDTNCALWPC